jgi:hypothetical protein
MATSHPSEDLWPKPGSWLPLEAKGKPQSYSSMVVSRILHGTRVGSHGQISPIFWTIPLWKGSPFYNQGVPLSSWPPPGSHLFFRATTNSIGMKFGMLNGLVRNRASCGGSRTMPSLSTSGTGSSLPLSFWIALCMIPRKPSPLCTGFGNVRPRSGSGLSPSFYFRPWLVATRPPWETFTGGMRC